MKLSVFRLALGLTASLAIVSLAGVKDTKHNFTSAASSPNAYFVGTRQVCVFCHTAHNGNSSFGALWNHEDPGPPAYDTYGSNTIDMSITQPHEGSLVCLSCHDGTIAVNSLSNLPGPGGAGNYGSPGGSGLDGAGKLTAASSAYVGTDLNNDHPVGVLYDASQDITGFVAKTGVSANYPDKLLWNSLYVECSSCHNPHDDTYGNFLVESNANSNLCTRCHTK
ncbi:MAG: cytochrome c3 family protein [candidate division Zixibacteria bacterium]